MKMRVSLCVMVLLVALYAGTVWGYTEGGYNNFFGTGAGEADTSGNWNTFIGGYAGHQNTTGSHNTFVGMNAGAKNDTGVGNNFFGHAAGYSNTGGSSNTFTGYEAGQYNTTGNGNNFMGYQAGSSNTTGNGNNFIGYQAGSSNSTGQKNAFIGNSTGYSNSSGNLNIFIGDSAGYENTIGNWNTFVGSSAGYHNTGYGNVFLGSRAGESETGSDKLYIDNCYGGNCTNPLIYGEFDNHLVKINGSFTATGGIQFQDGTTQTSGLTGISNASNSFFGQGAGNSNKSGHGNTFLGQDAGRNSDIGNYNTFIGHQTGVSNTAGNNNTFLGSQAGSHNETGNGNVFVGYLAGSDEKGSDKLYIANSSTSSPLIYGDFTSSIVKINGHLGVGIAPSYLFHLAGGAYSDGTKWFEGSSKKYKKNILALSVREAVDVLNGLNPVKFTYKDENTEQHVGFIAEDVPDLVATKDRKGLSPMDIVAILTKVVQEKSATIDALIEKLNKLEAEVNRLKNKDLTARAVVQ